MTLTPQEVTALADTPEQPDGTLAIAKPLNESLIDQAKKINYDREAMLARLLKMRDECNFALEEMGYKRPRKRAAKVGRPPGRKNKTPAAPAEVK